MTTTAIMDKLAKLKAHAESAAELGNAAEAAAFMAKIRALLVKHELSMSDIDYAQTLEDDPVGEGRRTQATTSQRRLWSERLASVIGKAFFCKILVTRGTDAIIFVGRESHRLMAEYLYVKLRNEVDHSSKREYKRLRSRIRREGGDLSVTGSFKEAFRKEYIKTIRDRLEAERKRERQEAEGTGTSLIRLDQALVRVKEFMDGQSYSTMKSLSQRDAANQLGQDLGRAYGERANLSVNGVNEGTTHKKLN